VYQFPLPSPRRQDPRGPSPNLSLNRPPLNSGIHIAAEHLGIETNCCLNKQPLDSHSLTNPLTVLCIVRVVFATALIWVFSHLSCSGPRAICVWWWWYLLPRATCCVHTIIQYIILHYIPYTASTPCELGPTMLVVIIPAEIKNVQLAHTTGEVFSRLLHIPSLPSADRLCIALYIHTYGACDLSAP